jgi:hypothetical protein
MNENAFDPDRLQARVRSKAQLAIAPLLEPGDTIEAMVPGISAGPEKRKLSLRGLARRRLVVATAHDVYVFSYRFGKVGEIELRSQLGELPVTAHDTDRGGFVTIGDLSLRIGSSVWRDWRDEALRLVRLNTAAATR